MKKNLLFIIGMVLIMISTACGSGSATKTSSRYEEILKCEGRYVQRSEDFKDTYGAELSFYEKDGKVYANIAYSGFIGTIDDGEVEDSTDSEYLYEIHPMGRITPNSETDMEFLFRFDEEKMYIFWGETCEYTLTRSDGSPEDEVDQKTPFNETEVYKTIVEKIDESFDSFEHSYVFDEDSKTFSIYIEAPDGLRSKFAANYDAVSDSWDKVVKNMEIMGSKIYEVLMVGSGYEDVQYSNLYMVDKLNTNNDYANSDIFLTIENGEVTYDIGNEYRTGTNKSYGSKSTSDYSYSENNTYKSGSSNSNNNYSSNDYSSSASAGERNALEKAYQYLNYSAFSYSGLVDQLEYEGFTNSEATYAADHCGADWYEQAVKKAQQYLEYSSFSRESLQDQLEYEGFSSDQASYGVQQAYH